MSHRMPSTIPYVIIPACGAGSRFSAVGHEKPKPLISVYHEPMLAHVLRGLRGAPCNVVLAVPKSHKPYYRDYLKLFEVLRPEQTPCMVRLDLEGYAAGAVATVLCVAEMLPDKAAPVMVLNSDNVITPASGWTHLWDWMLREADASTVLFEEGVSSTSLVGPYSYAEFDCVTRAVSQVQEKRRLAPAGAMSYACAGAFWFRTVDLLTNAARKKLSGLPDVAGEHYVAPMLNYLLPNVNAYLLAKDDVFISMGIPESLPIAARGLKHVYECV